MIPKKEIYIFVEGISDKTVLESLLGPLIINKRNIHTYIKFNAVEKGDAKHKLLTEYPKQAVSLLKYKPYAHVIILPDLYPKNKGFPHTTPLELKEGAIKEFQSKCKDNPNLADRFHVFCLKHDLEMLLLASKENLRQEVGEDAFDKFCKQTSINWENPEDQNHDNPPKKIIVSLFDKAGKKYTEVFNAPNILSQANYTEIAQKCPEFNLFVDFLENS